ncbi:MAG: hypothetical protein Q6370_020410, partial [Candidatus Sigynarchaeota archaeon]
MLRMVTAACAWMFTLAVFGPPLSERDEIASVPVQFAVIVTEAVVAAAATVTVNACVFVPPAFNVIVAGEFGARCAYPPNVNVA